MEFWDALQTKGLTPARLWLKMDMSSRVDAAESLYNHDWEGDPVTHEANMEIAAALRFRPVAIKKMRKVDKINYLAKAVRPSRSLVSSLMLALHLEKRSNVMATFLDALGFPHEDGLIDEEFEFEEVEKAPLLDAVKSLMATHPESHVDLYLATLYMMDPQTWRHMGDVMSAISTGQQLSDSDAGADAAPEVKATKKAKTAKATAKKVTKKPAAKRVTKKAASDKADATEKKAAKKTTKKATTKKATTKKVAKKATKKAAPKSDS